MRCSGARLGFLSVLRRTVQERRDCLHASMACALLRCVHIHLEEGMKSVGRIAVLVGTVMVLSSSTSSAQLGGLGRVKGIVNDDSGAPIKGAAVRATLSGYDGAIEETSDDKGAWTIGGMARGEWHLTFYSPGHVSVGAKVTLSAEL